MWLSIQDNTNPFKWVEDLEFKKQQEEADKKYNQPLNVSFSEQKSDLMKSLYWVPETRTINEMTNESINKLNKDQQHAQKEWKEQQLTPEQEKQQQEKLDLEKFKEHPNYPILERFSKLSWTDWKSIEWTQLTNNDLLQLSKALDKNWWKDDIEKLKSTLKDVKFDNPMTWSFLSSYLEKVKELNPSSTKKETKDKWWEIKVELPAEFKKNDLLNNDKDDIVQLLAKNYKKFPDLWDWTSDFNKDIMTTFEISANKLIEGKQIKRNESFDLAMRDVKNSDLKTRFFALKYLNSYINTSEWLKWVKSMKSYQDIVNSHEDNREEYVEVKIEQLNKDLEVAKNKWDEKKTIQIQEEIAKLETQKTKWDVFEAWQLDVANEKESPIQEAK